MCIKWIKIILINELSPNNNIKYKQNITVTFLMNIVIMSKSYTFGEYNNYKLFIIRMNQLI